VDDIEGVSMWYINHPPAEQDLSTTFGYKAEFNGIGIFLFKHEQKWRMMSIYNQGLGGLTIDTAVNNLTTPDNNCPLYDFDGGAIDIKMKVEKGRLSLDYASGGSSEF